MIYAFDLDGTLIDSTFRHGFLMEGLLNAEGIKTEKDFQEKYMSLKRDGMSSKSVLNEVYGLDTNLVDRIVKKWVDEIESDEMLAFDKLYDDSIETLERIKGRGEKIYYLSLRQREAAAIEELKRLEIYEYAEEVYIGKPSEGVEYKAEKLKRLKLMDDVTMVGDTEIDYESAKIVKVRCCIVNTGFRNDQYLKRITYSTYDAIGLVD